MQKIEERTKEEVGRGPDAKAFASTWTENGWKRKVEMYWIAPDGREINALRELTESLEKATVRLNMTEDDEGNKVALLSCPKPGLILPS